MQNRVIDTIKKSFCASKARKINDFFMEIQLAVCSGSTGLYFKYSISVTVKKGASLTAEKPREAMEAKNRNPESFFSTYVDFHSLDGKGFDDGFLSRHVPIKFVSSFVPFDRIQFVSTQIETTCQVCCLSILNVFGDTYG